METFIATLEAFSLALFLAFLFVACGLATGTF